MKTLLSISNKVRFIFMAFLFLICIHQGIWAQSAGDYRSVTNAGWSALSSWERYNDTSWVTPTVEEGYPGENSGTGNVTISYGSSITMDVSPANAIGFLNVGDTAIGASSNTSAILLIGSNQLVVTGDVAINAVGGSRRGSLDNGSGTVKIGGAMSIAKKGTFIANSGTIEYNAVGDQTVFPSTYYDLVTSGSGIKSTEGDITVNHDISVGVGTTFDFNSSHIILDNAIDSTVTVDGTLNSSATGYILAQNNQTATLAMGASGLFRVFDVNGIGPGTTSAALRAQGGAVWILSSIATSGTVEYYRNTSAQTVTDMNYNNLIISDNTSVKTWTLGTARTINGTVTIDGNFTLSGSNTLSVAGNWTFNGGTFVPGTGTVNFNGTSLQVIDGMTSTFNNLTISNTTGVDLDSDLNVINDVVINGVFSTAPSRINVINIGGNWANNGTFTPGFSNVVFNGSSQTIGGSNPSTFDNLILVGTGTKTFSGNALTVGGNLDIGSGVVADLQTFTHTANSLVLGGTGTQFGSWGSTSSLATNTNNTFFAATSGIVNVTITTDGSCTAYNATLAVGDDTICLGESSSFDITIDGGVAPYTVVYNDGSGNVTFDNYISGNDIIVTPSATSTYTLVSVIGSQGCPATLSGSATITVRIPTAGSIAGAQTICNGGDPIAFVSTDPGSVRSGATASYRWESSIVSSPGWSVISGETGLTYDVPPGLTDTRQYRRTTISTLGPEVCESEPSNVVEVTISTATSNYVSGVWDNGVPTDGLTEAIIEENYTSAGESIAACSLTVINNAIVVISSGNTVALDGKLEVGSGASVTFNNNANLIQNGTTNDNVGDIIIKRDSSMLKRLDYTLWSSPVSEQSSQTLLQFSPATLSDRFYRYKTDTNLYNSITPSATTFETAKGYLIRMPDNHPVSTPTIWTGSFTGVPNNGDYNYRLEDFGEGMRFNLVGNPYPSPINANEFVTQNSSNITGTLYFWRKTNNPASPSYCTWTTAGFTSNGEAQVEDPANVIQTGQGFFVEAQDGASNLDFTNTMRIDNHANQFFKMSGHSTERNRIWLNASDTAGAFCQTMVGYMPNATQEYDFGIDGKYFNDGYIALTSLIGTTPYVIQGRALPFDSSDRVTLSFNAKNAGNYTIAIDHTDGLFLGNQEIYLRDNLTDSTHDLKSGSYSFVSEAGTFTSRFELVYQESLALKTSILNENQVIVYKNKDRDLVVNTGNILMQSVQVFDIQGRLFSDIKDINANQAVIKPGMSNGILLMKITTEQGNIVTKKVVN